MLTRSLANCPVFCISFVLVHMAFVALLILFLLFAVGFFEKRFNIFNCLAAYGNTLMVYHWVVKQESLLQTTLEVIQHKFLQTFPSMV
ncbi:hypothetical protein BY996DRAFT_432212 [Phakopsora pachyrhizi]|nr:hypothetical protein BY996DRAFT_432212 [Phakopsora pachyrhizi]